MTDLEDEDRQMLRTKEGREELLRLYYTHKIEDMFVSIFRLQKEYNSMIHNNERYPRTRAERVDKLMEAVIHEAVELQDETNWKWWKQPKPVNLEKAREELIDILHFIIDACMELDMDAQQTYMQYLKKNQINRKRQESGY